eukprot:3985495-Pleurochrysis_carterae.AAC.3
MSEEEGASIDCMRQGAVRYLGYANEVGEAFKPLVHHRVVTASYVVAGAYVTTDAAWRAAHTTEASPRSPLVEAVDTFAWQSLASVMTPGAVINRLVWATGKVAPSGSKLPTVVGLAAIPLIIRPIDHGVDLLFNKTIRTIYSTKSSP